MRRIFIENPSAGRWHKGPRASFVAVTLLMATTAFAVAAQPDRAKPAPPPAPAQPAQPTSAAAQAPPIVLGNGPHGAMPSNEQLSRVASLFPKEPDANAPAGVNEAFWRVLVPTDNAIDAKRIALGKKLYFDPRLSRDGTVSCATCHDVSRGFTDRRPTSEGIDGKLGRRNAPTSMNAMFFTSLFLDGRAATLEEQARLPIVNPIEMGQPDGAAVAKAVGAIPEYQRDFAAAYGRPVSYEDIGRAIATFERTLVFLDSPFDRFSLGDASAISDDAKSGFALYNGKARCATCHQLSSNSPIGTNNKFHNIGVSARHQDFGKLANRALASLEKSNTKETMDQMALETDLSELGRFVVTRNRSDIGGFKTSQVRNVGITSPYMHDGSMQTLWDVVDHYNKGGEANPYLDGGIEPLALSEREVDQLVAFLFTLTDKRFAEQNASEMERQRAVSRKNRPFRDDALANRKRLPFEPQK
ncbi:cytochrome-c peroxidase [Pendulispora albinea]|uniref:Cytochrome-c peroxidase n=1 Tax=Pendulispora albinea TaxID=2741071 RepID=A0ABZ2M5F6_9BACT